MDTRRAQEIIDSPVMINVTHQGVPIYIKDVDPDRETATIYPMDDTGNEQEVDVNALIENAEQNRPH
ncbi:small acid-soluble spore protein H (minor) [Evansella caseinilytica]|uniref:Small, acid-soluble spore protein H n=1 Tax=Evansella caseinilytica TaxID=1503961 RepID=A0A1H3REN5_9BACI|nr:H-type small acid-soluble spore protein [Evansella caseinilytica]SDZ23678.1 small acid-soluble spore protein H (minor) [Evansella caseinilytica]